MTMDNLSEVYSLFVVGITLGIGLSALSFILGRALGGVYRLIKSL